MLTNEGRVYFALDGDSFDPDEVTKFIGATPTYIKRKGERVSGHIPKKSSWVISTENIVNDYIDIYQMSSEVVGALQPRKDKIIAAQSRFKIKPRFSVVLSIATNEDISTPAIGFDAEVVKFLGEVGAYIDIDTYRN